MSENFRSLRGKLCPCLCDIGLFHIVWGVFKGTRDNYLRFGKNILCPKYIDIYELIWKEWMITVWPEGC